MQAKPDLGPARRMTNPGCAYLRIANELVMDKPGMLATKVSRGEGSSLITDSPKGEKYAACSLISDSCDKNECLECGSTTLCQQR